MAAQDILRSANKHVVRLTYVGNIDGDPKIDEESLEAKWLNSNDIKRLSTDELDIYFRELIDKSIIILFRLVIKLDIF